MKPSHAKAGINRDPMRGSVPESVAAVLMLTGSDAGTGVTSLPLAVNGATLGAGLPGIPISFPCRIGRISASVLTGTLDAGDWTLTAQVRRAGSDFFNDAATLDVATPES